MPAAVELLMNGCTCRVRAAVQSLLTSVQCSSYHLVAQQYRRVRAGAGTQQQSSCRVAVVSRAARTEAFTTRFSPSTQLHSLHTALIKTFPHRDRSARLVITRSQSVDPQVTLVIQCCDLCHVIFSSAQALVLTGEIIVSTEINQIVSGVSKIIFA